MPADALPLGVKRAPYRTSHRNSAAPEDIQARRLLESNVARMTRGKGRKRYRANASSRNDHQNRSPTRTCVSAHEKRPRQ